MTPLALVRESPAGWEFYCPACRELHFVDRAAGWILNTPRGPEKPTLVNVRAPSSSILLRDAQGIRCHVYVIEGSLVYCNDCAHELRGVSVPMIPIGGVQP